MLKLIQYKDCNKDTFHVVTRSKITESRYQFNFDIHKKIDVFIPFMSNKYAIVLLY